MRFLVMPKFMQRLSRLSTLSTALQLKRQVSADRLRPRPEGLDQLFSAVLSLPPNCNTVFYFWNVTVLVFEVGP